MEQGVVRLVAKDAGITEEQAGKAIVSVLNYVKANLPEQLHAPIDAAIKGDMSGLENPASMAAGLGGASSRSPFVWCLARSSARFKAGGESPPAFLFCK